MASSTTIDSNQLEEKNQEQQHVVHGQLSRQTEKNEQSVQKTNSVATKVSVTNLPTTTTTTTVGNGKGILALEQQLLIELDSDDKQRTNNKNELRQRQQRKMELRQIELIYRAEGNANLVLALPQFKKVLRLPKSPNMKQRRLQQQQQQQQQQEEILNEQMVLVKSQQSAVPHVVVKVKQEEEKEEQIEGETMQYQNTSASTIVHQNAKALTMQDFVAYMQIIRKLFGQAYVLQAEIVSVPNESDRIWMSEQISAQRPANRMDKEFHGQFGLLLPDATLLPKALEVLLADLHPESILVGDVYAIEIKTKQGWLLPSDVNNLFDITPAYSATTVSDSSVDGNVGKFAKLDIRCRYCVMQFLKLKNGKIKELNNYCPMDLFSGHTIHMLKALDALFECPQNNLRVYRNGCLIYGDHANTMSRQQLKQQLACSNMELKLLKQLLMVCLLRDYTEHNKSDKAMPATHVGRTIATGQSSGVVLSVDAASASKQATTLRVMETEIKLATAQQQINETETQHLPKNSVLQQILHLQLLAKKQFSYMLKAGFAQKCEKTFDTLGALLKRSDIYQLPATNLLEHLNAAEQYMLGATMLDCSVIIAFQEVRNLNEHIKLDCANIVQLAEAEGRSFLSKVSIIDLDPKPDSHFYKYLKQTKEAIDVATATAATQRTLAN